MSPITLNQKISVPEDVLVQVLDGESVLLNLQNEQYYGLDDIGTRMWEVLAESQSIEEAYRVLLAEYQVEPEQLRQDLQVLLEKLVEHGLVELSNP
ncbi:MAG: PqqD family peptide modification chaperone [Cyanosarcina radialis HA8281-LM2]|jgi:hypothetical protein|nr:PqqD family peptide modification chaperone [Cyanosarcina radialis HA8281-LM2]